MSKKVILSSVALGVVVLLVAGFMFTGSTANDQGVKTGEWTMDYDSALKFANENKLPVMLNFTGSDWCVWCKLMQKSVFSQDEWKQYAKDRMVLVTLDFPRNKDIVPVDYQVRNQQLQQKYGVQGYPTYIILDSDGKTILGKLGAGRDKTPQSFIQEVEDVLMFSKTEIEKTMNKLTPEQAKSYRETLDKYGSLQQELESWLNTRPERNEANVQKYNAFLDEITRTKEALANFN
jgi:protein disulfide-isomerase